MSTLDRRTFLAATAFGAPFLGSGSGLAAAAAATATAASTTHAPPGPVAISSGNGPPAVTKAVDLMKEGVDPVDAVVAGVGIVEADPEDVTVGYGGLPNEDGVVELDAACMHGPTHKAGAVAALRNIMHPAQVALLVLRRTDHVLLVGEGALQFALAHGFEEEDLLTDRAREAWLRWKANLNPDDDLLDDDQRLSGPAGAAGGDVQRHWGTIHCSAVNPAGELACCTTTSGLSFKLPGRVGDSPLVGAGLYCDNEIGSAGATGRGESVIQSCGSFQVVQHMAAGLEPTDACLKALKFIADHTRRTMLLNDKGEPNFNVVFYALRKDGAYGSAAMHRGRTFTVRVGDETRTEECAFLFE